MIEWSMLLAKGKRIEFHRPCIKAAMLAPFSIPVIGLLFSLIQPMPNQPITTMLGAFEYLGLFSIGALVLGFPLGLLYGYPVLRLTSRLGRSILTRFAATIALGLVPPFAILVALQELNYFTSLCLVMSVTTAICAQCLLLRLEMIERS